MGDIADMMINGILDQHTGEYLGDEVGYPRSHNNKIEYSSDDYKIRGILYYCMIKGVTKKNRRKILLDFFKVKNEVLIEDSKISSKEITLFASNNFKEFKSFFYKYQKQIS